MDEYDEYDVELERFVCVNPGCKRAFWTDDRIPVCGDCMPDAARGTGQEISGKA